MNSSRMIFHEFRQPDVLVLTDTAIIPTRLADFSDDGLTLLCMEDPALEPGQAVSALCFGALASHDAADRHRRLESPYLGRVRFNETSGQWSLRFQLNDPEQITSLSRLIGELHSSVRGEVDPDVDRTRLPKIPHREHYTPAAVDSRIEWLRRTTGGAFENLQKHAFRVETLAGNIENFIGAVQVPVGLAGPLHVRGLYARGHVPLPIATTEGALVASLNRGAAVLNLSGGVRAHVLRQTMLRAPVFFCEDLDGALHLERWILAHEETLREKCSSVSSVARLTELRTFVFGDTCHVRFLFQTGDAAGQNMTTSCTYYACEWIREQLESGALDDAGFRGYVIEANMSGDKKVNLQNFGQGRGVAVIAEAFVPEALLESHLRTSSRRLAELMHTAEAGALHIGMIGHNINCANVIAGIFTATGQDIASVHESALAIFKAHAVEGGMKFSMYLPCLVIGTVGGGTRMPTQSECLDLLGCAGQGRLFKFAEIIAGACLALDLSTLSAVSSNEFVSAHERLGRNRPTARLARSELNTEFIRALASSSLNVRAATEIPLESNSGIISEIASKRAGGVFGVYRYRLTLEDDRAEVGAVLKLKSPGDELARIARGIARLSGDDVLPGHFDQHWSVFGLAGSDQRELDVVSIDRPELRKFLPRIYGVRSEPARDLYAILMEDLTPVSHLDTVHQPLSWKDAEIARVLEDLAELHSAFLDGCDALPGTIARKDLSEVAGARPLFESLARYNWERYSGAHPEIFDSRWRESLGAAIARLPESLAPLGRSPVTLTHNDFNTRNLGLRGEGTRLVAYDWELACVQAPQRDALEFLLYALPEQRDASRIEHWLEHYRLALRERASPRLRPCFDGDRFLEAARAAGFEFAINRLGLYWLVHNAVKFGFLPRISLNLKAFLTGSGA